MFMQEEGEAMKKLVSEIKLKGKSGSDVRKKWLKFLHAICDDKFNRRFPVETGGKTSHMFLMFGIWCT